MSEEKEEKIEVFTYRKDDITDFTQISLQKGFVTRDKLAESLKTSAEHGKEYAVFEKSTTPSDVWLVLLKCYDMQIYKNEDIKEQLENIRSAIDDIMEDL